MAHIVEFEMPYEIGKADAKLVGEWVELFQAIRLSRNKKGRLNDLRAFSGSG